MWMWIQWTVHMSSQWKDPNEDPNPSPNSNCGKLMLM